MKKRIKFLKPVQSYDVGSTHRISSHFADKLIARGQAVEVKDIVAKEEKHTYETKEEKFTPFYPTKEKKDFSITAVSKIDFTSLTDEELLDIIKNDQRKTAIRLAQEEIRKRGN